MTKPVLAGALLVVAAGAWHVALRPAVAPMPTTARAPAAVAAQAATAVPTVRLEQLNAPVSLRPAPAASRNPFASTVAGSAARAASGLTPGPAPLTMETPPAPAWPRVTLIGVAETDEGRGLARTAIISGPHGVHHARPGDVIEQVYRVQRVGADAVDLLLLPEGRTLQLALRP